jgi:hypothetical protein
MRHRTTAQTQGEIGSDGHFYISPRQFGRHRFEEYMTEYAIIEIRYTLKVQSFSKIQGDYHLRNEASAELKGRLFV